MTQGTTFRKKRITVTAAQAAQIKIASAAPDVRRPLTACFLPLIINDFHVNCNERHGDSAFHRSAGQVQAAGYDLTALLRVNSRTT